MDQQPLPPAAPDAAPARSARRTALGVAGVVLALFSLFLVVSYSVELITGSDPSTSPGVHAGLIVFFSGTLAAGGWMTRRGFGLRLPGRSAAHLEHEQRILALARAQHGRLTIAEVAALCGLSLDVSKEELDRMHRKGIADIDLTATGVLVYSFPGLTPDDEG